MIAIDLDGTLLSPKGEVTPRTKAAVHKCLAAGMLVCFATGRNWTESRTVIDAVEHYGSAVFVGGAMVIDTGKRVTLHRTLMAPDLARAVSGVIEAEGHAALALQDTEAAGGVDYLVTADVPMVAETEHWMSVTAATVHRRGRLADHDHAHTVRVGLVAATPESRRVREVLIARFAERILCHSLWVPAYDVEVLEVFDPGVNKWQGILHVARNHGIAPEQIIAVGDDMNDVPMLQAAGLGVAMGNARPEARAAAKMTIGANADDGLAVFLEQLVERRMVLATE
ncbi:MAG TPA: HAD family hydrolase [Humisphaera sp.]